MEFDVVKFFEEQKQSKLLGNTQRKIISMSKKLTKGDVVRLFNTLNSLIHLRGAKFTYAVSKNISGLKSEVEALQKVLEQSTEMKEFETKRIALAEKHAKKDSEGKPITANNNYVLADQAAFDAEFKALKEENAKVVEEYENQVKSYNELLKEDASVELHMVKLSDVPEDITALQMNGIIEIVQE